MKKETNTIRTCPKCGTEYQGYPAISRKDNKTPIFVVQGASPNPIMRYLAINNLWAESLETGVSGAEMGYWDGMYHIEFEIGTSTLTLIVEKKG